MSSTWIKLAMVSFIVSACGSSSSHEETPPGPEPISIGTNVGQDDSGKSADPTPVEDIGGAPAVVNATTEVVKVTTEVKVPKLSVLGNEVAVCRTVGGLLACKFNEPKILQSISIEADHPELLNKEIDIQLHFLGQITDADLVFIIGAGDEKVNLADGINPTLSFTIKPPANFDITVSNEIVGSSYIMLKSLILDLQDMVVTIRPSLHTQELWAGEIRLELERLSSTNAATRADSAEKGRKCISKIEKYNLQDSETLKELYSALKVKLSEAN